MTKRRRRRSKSGRQYFTQVHEDAIVRFVASSDPRERTELYVKYIQPAFDEFIHKVKKNAKRTKREVEYDNMSSEAKLKHLSCYNNYDEIREKEEFFNLLWTEIESWDGPNLKPNEKKVLDAIRILMEESDNIEIFNKKAIYLYMREITGLNTKQIVNNLNKMRIKYRAFKYKWDEGSG